MKAAKERFYASHFWNPWFNHGTKTWAFEVWEQLGFRSTRRRRRAGGTRFGPHRRVI